MSPRSPESARHRQRSASKPPAQSDSSPLLPSIRRDAYQGYDGYSSASFSSAVFSICTSVVGAGIMSLPATMKTAGVVPGVLLIVFVGLMTNASLEVLLKFSEAGKAISYGSVMADAFGRLGRAAAHVCIVVNNFGLCVVYMIMIADVLSGSTSSGIHHSGVLEEWGGGSAWWNTRIFVMFITTAFVLLPLASFRHIDSLRHSSALSLALAVVFVVVTSGVAMDKLVGGEITMPALFPHPDSASSFLNLFSAVPVLVTAYICHHAVHPVVNELQNSSQGMDIVRISLMICTAIYVATSLFGYMLFGDQTMNDVLLNFDADLGVPYSDILSNIVRVGYAVHLMLVFPLLHFALRLNLDGLIFPALPPLSTDTRRFVLITTVVITLSFLGASLVPSIWDAFQFTGSTSAVCIGFIFPGIIVLRDAHGIATRRETCVSWIMVILAVGSSMIAIISNIYNLFGKSKTVPSPSGPISHHLI